MNQDDIETITQQTGCEWNQAKDVLKECDGDLVEAIIYLSQSEEERKHQEQRKLDKEKKLTTSEKNIKELREIVDEKDKYFSSFMDQQFQRQHQDVLKKDSNNVHIEELANIKALKSPDGDTKIKVL